MASDFHIHTLAFAKLNVLISYLLAPLDGSDLFKVLRVLHFGLTDLSAERFNHRLAFHVRTGIQARRAGPVR